MCGAGGHEKQAAAGMQDFTNNLTGQAKAVFGDDNAVFNNMLGQFESIRQQGLQQMGFSQAEYNALVSQAQQNVAAQYRGAATAARTGQSAFGGGNVVPSAGVTTAANLDLAEKAATAASQATTNINLKNAELGQQNFWKAMQGEETLPSAAFENIPKLAEAVTGQQKENLGEQKGLDAAASWWKKPVMSLVGAGLNLASGGIGGVAGSLLDVGQDVASNMAAGQ